MLTFLSSTEKQKCIRFRIAKESIDEGEGFISISLDVLILHLFCNRLNDPFRITVVSGNHILNGLVPSSDMWSIMFRLC